MAAPQQHVGAFVSCSCDVESQGGPGSASTAGTAQHSALKMRACLAWVDGLLKCLASGGVGGQTDARSGAATVAHGRESLLLHVVTSFAPGSHSRTPLEPGTAAQEARQMLGGSGTPPAVVLAPSDWQIA